MKNPTRSVFLLAMLTLASALSAAELQFQSFDDCGPAAIEELRARIFQGGPQNELAPIILARDVVHLQSCGSGSPQSEGAALERRLERYVVEERELVVKTGTPLFRAARDGCVEGFCEFFRRADYQPPEAFGLAKSGGLGFFAMFLGHVGKAGHYEITGRALETMRAAGSTWSAPAVEILRDASRDADFYEWNNPSAHAQTRNSDADGKISQPQADARQAFESWTRGYLARAEAQCAAGNTRVALYLLGYAFHGVQDLVFHEGITNAEHSFRDFVENRQIDAGDRYDEKMALAARATLVLLERLRDRLAVSQPGCWQRLTQWRGPGALDDADKRAALGFKDKDFTVSAYFAYRSLSQTLQTSLLSRGLPADYFIAQHWLQKGQEPLLVQFIERIFQ